MTATPTPGDLSARLLAYATRKAKARDALGVPAGDYVGQEEIDTLCQAAAALSALPAGGEEAFAWQLIDERGKPVYLPYTNKADAIAMQAHHASLAAHERETFTMIPLYTTPPPDAAVGAQGEDDDRATIGGAIKMLRADGFTRMADAIQRRLATPADVGAQGEDTMRHVRSAIGFLHSEGRSEQAEAIARLAAPAAGKGDPINPAFWIQAIRTACYTTDCSPKQQTLLNAADNLERYIALTRQPVAGDGWAGEVECCDAKGTWLILNDNCPLVPGQKVIIHAALAATPTDGGEG